jgi:hypothetical protein
LAKPIETVSVPSGRGAFINASIWANDVEQDGERYTSYSVTIEKRYRDKEKQWQSAKSFDANELLQVAYVASQAYERVLQLRSDQSD